MTAKEWAAIAALIDNLWKDDFDKDREGAYLMVLARHPAVDVHQAVVNLGGRPGGPFAPASTEIAAEVHAVQFVGTAEWARQRLAALCRTEHLYALDPDFPTLFANGQLRGEHIAEHLLAIHDEHGKRLLQLVARQPLRRVSDAAWWQHGGATSWDAQRFAALEPAAA